LSDAAHQIQDEIAHEAQLRKPHNSEQIPPKPERVYAPYNIGQAAFLVPEPIVVPKSSDLGTRLTSLPSADVTPT